MATNIKISEADELKILKSYARKLVLARQIHKSKKTYSRLDKHKKTDY